MKILVTIPHFYRPEKDSPFGSLEKNPINRIRAIKSTILSLHQSFGQPQCIMNLGNRTAIPANHQLSSKIDIVICTTENHHLLSHLAGFTHLFKHHPTTAAPRLLGFECHEVLQQAHDKYDYYCFMEDDLIIHDSLFFHKLAWFTAQTGNQNLLQPNRYETKNSAPFYKGYIDGEISSRAGAPFQNINDQYELHGKCLGVNITFRRTTNPHSGCFFLNAEQMNYWLSQPYYLDRDTGFVDPMASAATLGITKTFRVYKPVPANGCFLEIEHVDQRYLWQVGTNLEIDVEGFRQIGYQFTKMT